MLYITRREHFSSSHILNNPGLSAEENQSIFGKCNNFHGHNYYMEVTLAGEPDPKSGYVMDLKVLKEVIQNSVLNVVDHRFLNDLEIFKGIIPTTENMAMVFWNILKKEINLPNARLFSIKLFETEKNFVEYKGE
jgi:6-pyruvoyltetrahydropterin/6-carboxytetrahydropterin synthase